MIQILNYINSYITNINLQQKIILYAIPLAICFSAYISFHEMQKKGSLSNSKVLILNEKINLLHQKSTQKQNFLDEIKKIENFALENNILIESINQDKNMVTIDFKSKKEELLRFLRFCELFSNYSKISYLTIKKQQNINLSQIKISFEKFYIKDSFDDFVFEKNKRNEKDNHKGKIRKKSEKKNKNEQKEETNQQNIAKNSDFKVNAIVGNFVLINTYWIKINDVIENYKVVKIYKQSVVLEEINTKRKLRVGVFENEIK